MPPSPVAADSGLPPRPAAGRMFEGVRRVRLADARPSGRLRLDAAARFLQDVSADDTADAALPDSQAWVVRRTVIEVLRFPRYLEGLRLATWCSGTGSHYAERRVEMRGEWDGAVDAVSLWVHVDAATGRPRRLGEGFTERYAEAASGRRVSARLVHPDPPADVELRPWPLRATDLDVLGHMNNAAYWQVVEEALALQPGPRGPMRVEVEHRRAVEPGALVDWAKVVDDDGGFTLWVLADAVVAATARLLPG